MGVTYQGTGAPPTGPRIPLLTSAFKRTCPRCGHASIFAGYLALVDRCPHCGLPIERADTADGPAFFVMFAASPFAAMVGLVLLMGFSVDMWWAFGLTAVVYTALCVALLPPTKALMVAIQYKTRPDAFEEGATGPDTLGGNAGDP